MKWLDQEELKQFKSVGVDVLVDSTVAIINPQNISLGNHVRIDCFCMLSAVHEIEFGDYIHLAPYVQMQATGAKIMMKDYTALASKTTILTASDDFVEGYMNNPTMPLETRKVKSGPVTLEKFVMTGVGCVILPGVTMHVGSAAGCLTLINKDVQPFNLIVGCPSKVIGQRNAETLYAMEKKINAL